MLMLNDVKTIEEHHMRHACMLYQAPFFCPLVGGALAAGFSELSILLYMPLMAGTVTPGRGQ